MAVKVMTAPQGPIDYRAVQKLGSSRSTLLVHCIVDERSLGFRCQNVSFFSRSEMRVKFAHPDFRGRKCRQICST